MDGRHRLTLYVALGLPVAVIARVLAGLAYESGAAA